MDQFKDYIYNILLEPSIKSELKYFVQEFDKNPNDYDFLVDNPQNLQENYKEAYVGLSQRYVKAQQMLKNKFPGNTHLIQNQHQLYELGTFYLHWQAFLPTIQMLGTQKQVEYWQDLSFKYEIRGGYAQTEVGHGSDVQGLQTTAVFENNSFIINTPTASSYKFWPGLLGIFATHAVVQAKTNVNGIDIGIQTFVVPIRESKTLKPLDGVDVGDIGPKLGFLRADNGYLGLKNVRVDRNNMLMRYTQVDESGKVTTSSKNAIKYGYGSMLNLRVNLVNVFSIFGLFTNNLAYYQVKPLLKTQSIENEAIMFKLLRSYVVQYSQIIANAQIKEIFIQFQNQLKANDKQVNETLQLVHLYSSQMKSISGWEAVKTSREAMQIAPFGHLNASDLIIMYADNVPFVTYEGDNNVLMQQTAQYLIKQFSKVSAGNSQFTGIASYFNKYIQESNKKSLIQNQEEILERLSYNYCKKTMENFQNNLVNGHSLQSSWNELNQCELIKASIIFGYTNIYKQMGAQIKSSGYNLELLKIHKLFGLFIMLENRTTIVSFGIADFSQVELLAEIDQQFSNNNKLEFLEYLSNGVGMYRQRNFININWDKLHLQARL
ncbi:unnamed protein product [Paramecium sonneborni]|uniref:Acyl-coenzyme A oxidase n=1 Tax=Paramecium sonneborni TaxID=65129 RepID=A0A8S1R1W4_9CILI|nr:unnamed protein product [Paramecium sonneborni]